MNNDSSLDRFLPLEQGVRWVLDHALQNDASLKIASAALPGCRLQRGDHHHETWEIFCPLKGKMAFSSTGRPRQWHSAGAILLVPPGLLHRSIHELNQPARLHVLVLDLPCAEHAHGALSVGMIGRRRQSVLSPIERSQWVERIGMAPDLLMERVASALTAGGSWERERAIAQLRLLFSAYMEVAGRALRNPQTGSAPQVSSILSFLQTRYYDANLDAKSIASVVGFSPSYVRHIVREETGNTLHQTLLGIRLQRAEELLQNSLYSIKEISFLTGWNHPLYFSAAFRKRRGQSPSAFRAQHRGQPGSALPHRLR